MRCTAQAWDAALAMARPVDAIIAGQAVSACDGARMACEAPARGIELAQVADCGVADVDLAVASARRACEAGIWCGASLRERKKVLHRLADLLERDADELALLESLDTGKPIADTQAVDIPLAIGTARYYAEALDKIYGEAIAPDAQRLSWALREPLGVVGAIVPWNFPLHMAMWKVVPALAMGNSVVLKPAELTPLSALRLGELALEAGLPEGVLNVVPGTGERAGRALALHGDVDMIAFTGSTAVGRRLMEYAGQSNLKRVSLELGGKSPHIVFEDCADLAKAAEAAAWGIFYNQGQVCTAGSRLLVHSAIREPFLEALLDVARTIRPGDPLDPQTRLGAVISREHRNRVQATVEAAAQNGARVHLAGGFAREESGGHFLNPSIVEVGSAQDDLAQREIFGPVLTMLEFEDEAQACRIANATPYGLAGGLWTSDLDRAHRVARAVRAGMVWINGWDACDITMPFGGFGQSGFGRDRSLHALEKYADFKAVTVTMGQA